VCTILSYPIHAYLHTYIWCSRGCIVHDRAVVIVFVVVIVVASIPVFGGVWIADFSLRGFLIIKDKRLAFPTHKGNHR
jgi:hypothetical protein